MPYSELRKGCYSEPGREYLVTAAIQGGVRAPTRRAWTLFRYFPRRLPLRYLPP